VGEAPASNTPFIMLGCIIVALAGLVFIWKKKA
jgi:LPXTG-motif cell wall-anchored protein